MCGIFAIMGSTETAASLRAKALKMSKSMRHRGPDWNGIYLHQPANSKLSNVLAHERLAIIDLQNGAQPLSNQQASVHLTVNGEIYNHEQIRRAYEGKHNFLTKSDCECIIPLYMEHKHALMQHLDGIFAFVVYDASSGEYLAARDPIGINSMYVGWHHSGAVWFASEMKALEECTLVREFPPGHYLSSGDGDCRRWYSPVWLDETYLPCADADYALLRQALETSVAKRLMTDVPFGVLLSGGLDSSLIAAIAAKFKQNRSLSSYGYQASDLLTFSIGLEDSPDLVWANKMAAHIGSKHHSFVFKIEEGIDALRDVIAHIETYDVTTVRASTPMFLMARRIKAMGIKVVLSGEGSDEIFAGYLYFHKAPGPSELQRELVHKISALSKYDCLRANKATAAWGVETRVPFLDKHFLEVAMSIDPKHKIIGADKPIEKYILRKAFDKLPYLPDEILWRQKEQFSDGVGYSWIDGLKDHANQIITDQQIKMAPIIYPYNTPNTKEAYLYREIFDSIFAKESCAKTVPSGSSIACSSPGALNWDSSWANMADPSGRAIVGVHQQAITH